MTTSNYTFGDVGQNVFVNVWRPSEAGVAPRGIVLVAHGMAEYGGRYARFAGVLTHNGYVVYAPDHRGHGATAAGELGWGGPDAWNGTIRDLAAIAARATAEHPGLPLFLFGHSMGSIAAQRFAELHGAELRGLILSGTTGAMANADQIVPMARQQAEGDAARRPSPFAGMMFATFNAAFEPVKTPFDWLSRDEAEVQKYIDDPQCGFAFTNGLLADHLAGWNETWRPENEAGIPKTLPILSIAGGLDPVGEASTLVTALSERYAKLGIEHIETVIYPGARHEILNETNRDDVHADVVTWLSALTA